MPFLPPALSSALIAASTCEALPKDATRPMAKTLIVKITCDRCKAEGGADDVAGDESVSFSYDGYAYNLDLCAAHAEAFHNTIQDLIGISAERERLSTSSRRARATDAAAGPPASDPARGPPRRDKEQLQAIREWAN